jgi:hypothetical protein
MPYESAFGVMNGINLVELFRCRANVYAVSVLVFVLTGVPGHCQRLVDTNRGVEESLTNSGVRNQGKVGSGSLLFEKDALSVWGSTASEVTNIQITSPASTVRTAEGRVPSESNPETNVTVRYMGKYYARKVGVATLALTQWETNTTVRVSLGNKSIPLPNAVASKALAVIRTTSPQPKGVVLSPYWMIVVLVCVIAGLGVLIWLFGKSRAQKKNGFDRIERG